MARTVGSKAGVSQGHPDSICKMLYFLKPKSNPQIHYGQRLQCLEEEVVGQEPSKGGGAENQVILPLKALLL